MGLNAVTRSLNTARLINGSGHPRHYVTTANKVFFKRCP